MEEPADNPSEPLPEIIVGVDLGHTFSGISFWTTGQTKPLVLQNWPDNNEFANKVPTVLRYMAAKSRPMEWGFNAQKEPEGYNALHTKVIETFKVLLDENKLHEYCSDVDSEYPALFMDDVEMWCKDFLTELCHHIRSQLCCHLKIYRTRDWNSKIINFVFSIPTVWVGTGAVERFKGLIASAGFASANHTATVTLTEAEAAIASTIDGEDAPICLRKYRPIPDRLSQEGPGIREGSTLLVVDAGGGTTDIGTFKVKAIQDVKNARGGTRTELKHLTSLGGMAIGSCLIDKAFEDLVNSRLELIDTEGIDWKPEPHMSKQMLQAKFIFFKKRVGTKLGQVVSFIAVPGLPEKLNDAHAGIKNGKMIFERDDFERLFDPQIIALVELIEFHIEELYAEYPEEKLTHIILSGGLCASEYVQDRLERRFGSGDNGLRILITEEPQLAVCRGLVFDRLHRLVHGDAMFYQRRCNSSYGICWVELHDKPRHDREGNVSIRIDSDGKMYAVSPISWFVIKGQTVSHMEPITGTLPKIVDRKGDNYQWQLSVVQSHAPDGQLPDSLLKGNAAVVATINCSLRRTPAGRSHGIKKVALSWTSLKPKKRSFYRIEQGIKVTPQASGLIFQVSVGGEEVGKKKVPGVGQED